MKNTKIWNLLTSREDEEDDEEKMGNELENPF